jgi:hypothetical protein
MDKKCMPRRPRVLFMTHPRIRVDMNVDYEHQALVAEAVLASGLRHQCRESWRTDEGPGSFESQRSGWSVVASEVSDRSSVSATRRVVARDASENLLIAKWEGDEVQCRVVARSSDEAASLIASLRQLLPVARDPDDDSVRVTFWNLADDRVRYVRRRIEVPSWRAVADNYHWRTRTHLEALVARPPMITGGKLILWHGPPGTGKTWALRALLHEWRGWAEAHYILDPENFFNQSASYMMSVIMDHERHEIDDEDPEIDGRWRLLIIEDASELLGKDARVQAGQGLARLLNLCDGLVGQGLRVLILLTTNEDVGTMHPAVIRRGRCIANIRFDLLSPEERQAWAAAHGVAAKSDAPALLADLFAADQIATPRMATLAGFQPRSHPG